MNEQEKRQWTLCMLSVDCENPPYPGCFYVTYKDATKEEAIEAAKKKFKTKEIFTIY